MPPASEFSALLREDRWIRRLAAHLVGDGATADDLVQETYLTALSSGARPRSARAWLGGVLRNLWRDGARSGARRERRERAAAQGELLPSSSELAAEVELRKRVAEAVLALEEPLRRTVVLRFFQDRSLPAIAAAEGVSVSTVHERVQRALARLRLELDEVHGGRREAWAATLITLARPASTGAGIGGLTMVGGLKAALVILALGLPGAWWWSTQAGAGVPQGEARVAAATTDVTVAQSRSVALAESVAPTRAPEPAPREGRANAAFPPPTGSEKQQAAISGIVLDAEGHGLGGVSLGWLEPAVSDVPATSLADGSFELALAGRTLEDNGRVVCQSPERVTLIWGHLFDEWRVLAAPRAAFGGTVVDPEGAPIAGAGLDFSLHEQVFRATGVHAFGLNDAGWHTQSDSAGHFALADVAGGASFFLDARAPGYVRAQVALPEGGAQNLVVSLARAQTQELTGLVLDPAGAPVPGAQVSAGKEIVDTDAQGHFSLVWDGGNGHVVQDEAGHWHEQGVEDASVIALKEGTLPAQEFLRERDLTAPFVLHLGPAPLSIHGAVLDATGEPRAGTVLWIGDPTHFWRELQRLGDGGEMPRWHTVEELLCAQAEPAAITDSAGGFELGCLMARSYSLLAFDPHTASRAGPWTIAAGAVGVELVFAAEPTTRVAGRVVSARGTPRAGLELTPRRGSSWAAGAEPPELDGAEFSVTTDAEGRFEFTQLATTGTSLQISSPPFSSHVVELAAFPDLAHLELIEPELCPAQIELSDPLQADSARIQDANGTELEINEVSGGSRTIAVTIEPEVHFVGGRSRLLSVPETAHTLVLYKAGLEVLRIPLALDPEQRTTVRP